MFLRTFIFAFLAVGAFAVRLELAEKARETIISRLTPFCSKTGGDAKEKAETLTNALQSFYDCTYFFVDIDKLEAEYNAAKPNATYNEVTKKHCPKTPEFKTCLHTLIDAASPCVVESAQNDLTTLKNGTDLLIDYMCYDDGSRVAQFLTENGQDCLYLKSDEIKACANTLSTQVDESLDKFLSLTLSEKCHKFDELTTCIFKSLESCPAPRNILESLVAHVRNGVCSDALPLPTPL